MRRKTVFHIIGNKILHLPSIRDITLQSGENQLHVNYRYGNDRTEILQFENREETEKAFRSLASALGL